MVTFEQFAETTSIHGVRDLLKVRRSQRARLIWTVLLVGTLGLMVYEMLDVVLNYLDRPTLTRISQFYNRTYQYPTILFCPRHWVNASRIRQLRMPKESLAYALSFLYLIDVRHPIDDVNDTEARLNELMSEYDFHSYMHLYLNISLDSETTMTCSSCSKWPADKAVTEHGVGFRIDFESMNVSQLIQNTPKITYNIPTNASDDDDWLPKYDNFYETDQIYIGYYQNDFFDRDAVKVARDRSYVVNIKPVLRKQSTINDHCYDAAAMAKRRYSQKMCYSDCEEITYLDCSGVRYLGYSYNKPRGVSPQLYSSYNVVEQPEEEFRQCQKSLQAKYDACIARCWPPCEELEYQTDVIVVEDRHLLTRDPEASITVSFKYQVKTGIMMVEEISTYTYHTFLSNIGGQMNLWLGASVLSVFELLFFTIQYISSQANMDNRAPNVH